MTEVHTPWDKSIDASKELASTRPRPVINAPELRGIRLVLVEDHDDTREAARRILERHGAQVSTGTNGSEGLAAIRVVRPDVVVTDLAMPEMDGYTLIQEVRALGAGSGGAVPVIALSAHSGPEERRRTKRAGFAVHLAKPISPATLIQAILDVVEQARGGPPG